MNLEKKGALSSVRGKFVLASLFFSARSLGSRYLLIKLSSYFFVLLRKSPLLFFSDRILWRCFLLTNLSHFLFHSYTVTLTNIFFFEQNSLRNNSLFYTAPINALFPCLHYSLCPRGLLLRILLQSPLRFRRLLRLRFFLCLQLPLLEEKHHLSKLRTAFLPSGLEKAQEHNSLMTLFKSTW